MKEEPLLSVVCVTYNHEPYIAQAVEGFLAQKVTFPVEIIIGDDCSTDKTTDICREYQKKYPEKIKLINLAYNIGPAGNFLQTLKAAIGKYVAYCEGDDYWTDLLKLQKQVDFLEANPDFSISSHNVKVLYEDQPKKNIEWLGKKNPEIMDLEHLLRYGSGGASCSLVFRNGVFGNFPSWYENAPGGDWALQVLCASKGRMRYFRDLMGVYRKHSRGSHYYAKVEAVSREVDSICLPAKNGLALNAAVNKHFGYKYDSLIQKQNIYYYKLYIKEYLKVVNLWGVLKYLILIIKARLV